MFSRWVLSEFWVSLAESVHLCSPESDEIFLTDNREREKNKAREELLFNLFERASFSGKIFWYLDKMTVKLCATFEHIDIFNSFLKLFWHMLRFLFYCLQATRNTLAIPLLQQQTRIFCLLQLLPECKHRPVKNVHGHCSFPPRVRLLIDYGWFGTHSAASVLTEPMT